MAASVDSLKRGRGALCLVSSGQRLSGALRSDQLLDLCALHCVRKVHENHRVRNHGRVIDIPNGATRCTRLTRGKTSSPSTCCRKTTASSTLRSASHGYRLTTEALTGSHKNNDRNEDVEWHFHRAVQGTFSGSSDVSLEFALTKSRICLTENL
jgi:hypothetical protein